MSLTNEQKSLFDELTDLQKSIALQKIKTPWLSNGEIYRSVTKRDITDCNARRLGLSVLSNPKVKLFLEACQTETIDDAIMSRNEMLSTLSVIARSHITDVVKVVNDHQELMDVSSGETYTGQTFWEIREDADVSPIAELTKGKDGLKVKLESRITAMKMIADLQGYNAPAKTELSVIGPKTLDDFYGDAESES